MLSRHIESRHSSFHNRYRNGLGALFYTRRAQPSVTLDQFNPLVLGFPLEDIRGDSILGTLRKTDVTASYALIVSSKAVDVFTRLSSRSPMPSSADLFEAFCYGWLVRWSGYD